MREWGLLRLNKGGAWAGLAMGWGCVLGVNWRGVGEGEATPFVANTK